MSPPDMSGKGTILGIDLGGALQATTGFAVLGGSDRAELVAAGVLPASKSADLAECRLIDLITSHAPDLIAVDAPLTLPPCLTCPSSCLGPDSGRCELKSAQLVWEAGGNPVTERLCEVLLRAELGGGKPLPTMRIGQIAARGVALARRLRALRAERGPVGGPDLIEVYPAGSIHRLGFRAKEDSKETFRGRILEYLSSEVAGLASFERQLADGHSFDALVAAYTAWLGPDRLEGPAESFNAATGWIWLPTGPGA